MDNSSATNPQRLHFGAAFYPEHWPPERWDVDIALMQQAKISVVRMAEFAWSTMEPRPGVYQFDWLETAINKLAEAGIRTVLGTPSAAPPAWLVQIYPDMLAVDENGRRVQFGNRCHYCVTSPEFGAASQKIAKAMAERFGQSPHIIGWQIDNEYNRVCYCPRCQSEFQKFLQLSYGTLDNLNEHWSTAYWSQTYSDWAQIPIPIGPHNPGLMLAFRRFITRAYQNFQKLQIDALRPYLKPDDWITHNFMGWFNAFDHYALNEDLDLASWDWYIGTGRHNYLDSGAVHDLTRGFKRKNFWLMETQPGHVNWKPVNTTLDKNEARAMAYHAIAHGADAILYWQWRSAYGGQEQYHGTLVDQSGQPRPFYNEARRLGKEIERLSPLLAGSEVKARIAILNDYESRWSLEAQPHNANFSYVEHLMSYYRAFASRNIAVDIISADASLQGYRLVVVPALALLDEKRQESLRELTKNNGHLIVTLRTGVKDRHNALLPSRPPGPVLSELTGVEVVEYYALTDPAPIKGNWFDGQSNQWAETLRLLTDRPTPIAHYKAYNGWLDDQPALSMRVASGPVHIYYVGAYFDPAAQQKFIDQVLRFTGIRPIVTPSGVEWSTRQRPDGQDVHFIINHTASIQTVNIPWPSFDHISGQMIRGDVQLGAYAVAIITKEKV